jgi:ADP-heptose:LPS heptosyltransferase
MVKAHSVGVGDLLRSSAAWRTLKNRWPDAQLHLLFLSKQQGYATEEIIKNHHLLASAHFITIRSGSPHELGAKNIPLKSILDEAKAVCAKVNPDLIIDFEAGGLRTSVVTRTCAKASGAKAVGISSFLGRSFFYDQTAPSLKKFAQTNKLSLPMDYTQRDYVALAALGLKRSGQAIELQVQTAGVQARDQLHAQLSKLPESHMVIGLNIGCGTPDALHKRPDLGMLADALGHMYAQTPFSLVLTGAAFEKDINQAFVAVYQKKWGHTNHIIDWAGQSSISGLTGVIDAVDVFISTDSGPYHMAVALRKPTLVLFTYAEVTSYHDVPWCLRLVAPYEAKDIVLAIRNLISSGSSVCST